MEINIGIDRNKCIKCAKCVKVCPAAIFSMEKPGSEVQVRNIQNCIVCGHCVAACPTFAVIHSVFPPEKVHTIDRECLPTPEQTLLLLCSRRSNRAFSKKPVPAEYHDLILEAAHRAPTASNRQEVNFTLVTDPAIIRSIATATVNTMYSQAKKLANPIVKAVVKRIAPDMVRYYPIFKSMYEAHHSGQDPVLRGATSIIFIHSPKESRFAAADCNLAYQNGSILAESLGVSQFYTGFVCSAIKMDKKTINGILGTDEVIHAGLALGMPQFLYPNYMDKKDIKVKKL